MNENLPTTSSRVDSQQAVNRRNVLKLVGGTTLALGGLTGAASAHSAQFSGCGRVCSDTDGDLAVVATGNGYEGRQMEAASGTGTVPWSHDNTYCYEAADDEVVVGFIEEKEWHQGEGCTLCLNPNQCATNHYDSAQEVIDNIDDASIGVCAGTLSTGDCTVTGAADGDGKAPDPASDVPLLNYALTLEHLERAFYEKGLSEFSDDELVHADALSDFGETFRMQVPDYLRTIGQHETAHVAALSEAIEALGGDPVGPAEYDFGVETPSQFLATARALEDTGVAAYTGAAPRLTDNDLLSAAASIQSVEARHASFLRLVNGEIPFPDVVDEGQSIEEVLDTAGQFVQSNLNANQFEPRGNRPDVDRKADDDRSDIEILNYALTLEHLENAFYRRGLETFTDDELMGADVLSTYDTGVRETVPEYLRTVGDHEAAHVTAISQTIADLGGDPVSEAEYDFGFENPSEFLGLAAVLETTGVSAYAGAAPSVSNDDVFSAAVGIHAVEARHSAYFNELNEKSPFPTAFDDPLTRSEVLDAAGQFIVEE